VCLFEEKKKNEKYDILSKNYEKFYLPRKRNE